MSPPKKKQSKYKIEVWKPNTINVFFTKPGRNQIILFQVESTWININSRDHATLVKGTGGGRKSENGRPETQNRFCPSKDKQQKSKHPTPVPALEGRYEWSSGCVSRRYQNGELKEVRSWRRGVQGKDTWLRPSLIADVSKIHQRKWFEIILNLVR